MIRVFDETSHVWHRQLPTVLNSPLVVQLDRFFPGWYRSGEVSASSQVTVNAHVLGYRRILGHLFRVLLLN